MNYERHELDIKLRKINEKTAERFSEQKNTINDALRTRKDNDGNPVCRVCGAAYKWANYQFPFEHGFYCGAKIKFYDDLRTIEVVECPMAKNDKSPKVETPKETEIPESNGLDIITALLGELEEIAITHEEPDRIRRLVNTYAKEAAKQYPDSKKGLEGFGR